MPDALDLDELDIPFIDSDKPRKATTRFTGLESFAVLLAKKRESIDVHRFRARVLAMRDQNSQSLVLRIATATDPLTLWAIHMHLYQRNVAPAHRWPGNTASTQMLFVSWCADLAWFVRRNPRHSPRFKSWQRLFKLNVGSPEWLETAFWRFESMHGRSLAHITAKAMGLSADDRQELMTLPTSAMVAARKEIDTENYAVIQRRLLTCALAAPDKSGKHKPADTANRKASMLRTHILSRRHAPTTAKHWSSLTGETLTRQAISKHVTETLTVLHRMEIFERSEPLYPAAYLR